MGWNDLQRDESYNMEVQWANRRHLHSCMFEDPLHLPKLQLGIENYVAMVTIKKSI